jgi:hypothetical protein
LDYGLRPFDQGGDLKLGYGLHGVQTAMDMGWWCWFWLIFFEIPHRHSLNDTLGLAAVFIPTFISFPIRWPGDRDWWPGCGYLVAQPRYLSPPFDPQSSRCVVFPPLARGPRTTRCSLICCHLKTACPRFACA